MVTPSDPHQHPDQHRSGQDTAEPQRDGPRKKHGDRLDERIPREPAQEKPRGAPTERR